MKVLVTGAAGFIGQHVARALADRGDDVLGLDQYEPPLNAPRHVVCNILDKSELSRVFTEFRPDAVVHLAARTDLEEKRDLSGYAANIDGVENILDGIEASGTVTRAICTSSQLVCRVAHVPDSDIEYSPTTLYGQSKVRTEQIWRARDGAGAEWCLVRPTTIWGPGMADRYLTFFRLLVRGRYVHIGPRPTRKSYGYVGNTVHQYLRLLDAPTDSIMRKTFYLADYEPIVLEDWVEAFQDELGGPRVRTVPLSLARAGALIGDLAVLAGVTNFPLTSFRLGNIRAGYAFDLSQTAAVCGALPYTMMEGVKLTSAWMRPLILSDNVGK